MNKNKDIILEDGRLGFVTPDGESHAYFQSDIGKVFGEMYSKFGSDSRLKDINADKKLYLQSVKSFGNVEGYWKSPITLRWYEELKDGTLGDEIELKSDCLDLDHGIDPFDEGNPDNHCGYDEHLKQNPED